MRVLVQDASTLRMIGPLNVTTYLQSKGWRRQDDRDGKTTLWLWQVGGPHEADVAVPMRQEFGDFTLRMAEVIRTLAQVEARSEDEVLRDLLATTADVIRLRATGPEAADGTLPLNQAVKMIERSRDLMLAAACAAIEKRAYFATRKPEQATAYVSSIRMGQTERGSFVLTILSPVPPHLRQPELFPDHLPEPYERQVTRTLLDSIHAVDQAARRAAIEQDVAPFREAIDRGVSANLCEAVAGLSSVSPGAGLDLEVSWAQSRPFALGCPLRVRLGADTMPIIQEAGRMFRDSSPVDDFDAEGVVTRLDRGERATSGDVTITGPIDGKMRRIVVELSEPSYGLAITAHGERRTVVSTGELVREGRGYRLRNPRDFRVLPQDDGA